MSLAVTALTTILMSATQPVDQIKGSCGADEPAIKTIKLETWPGYYKRQDVEGLGSFLMDDFRLVAADGKITERQAELEWLAANPWQPTDFVYNIRSILCPVPNVAMIIGDGQSTRMIDGKRQMHRYTSSNTLIRQGGKWRAALSHISGVTVQPLP
jgi:Domain of unknown function (DUF4440)